ncbi:MAG: hypothetical protein M0C28_16810 [Candidatus Moduliflexus flocculans]|nr:hypothetical protein [Candidatus Moduliflexus flocculans]
MRRVDLADLELEEVSLLRPFTEVFTGGTDPFPQCGGLAVERPRGH